MMAKGMICIRERKAPWWKPKNEEITSERKPAKSHKCKICSTRTYQKDSICVLCRTGIKEQYEELEHLLKIQE
jgi:hypothetical protein